MEKTNKYETFLSLNSNKRNSNGKLIYLPWYFCLSYCNDTNDLQFLPNLEFEMHSAYLCLDVTLFTTFLFQLFDLLDREDATYANEGVRSLRL